ncbi:flagella synthesis protein FlgN [Halomonas huangheensis]|uniref:Flagellar protein FlgN n=1 Tax=Halomonas huangheensis TaxID=1178482 RepID=W1N7E0_9GAMM|nr:flagellar protein FlgN [Halomonas huangheensis]ALM54262.1 hypothetical protein AR456_19805 [Halomonas huangheensis]ERL50810.1 hypothetical protein BJB45_19635 [Halomonas huangheensis]
MSLKLLLSQQHARLGDLLELLKTEQACLVAGRVDGGQLQQLARDKTVLQQALADTEHKRHQVQLRLGYEDSNAGAYRAACDAGCEDLWEQLRQRAEDTAHANRRSGEILQLRMDQNRGILEQIHRLANPNVYHADGRARLQNSRLNASA